MTSDVGCKNMNDLVSRACSIVDSEETPVRLRYHSVLVMETAVHLLGITDELGVSVDVAVVVSGALLHDIGKRIHTEELEGKGSLHESAGESLLLQLGLPDNVARICKTHADINDERVEAEDLMVAVSDKLWKGKRVDKYEWALIEKMAAIIGKDKWDIYEICSEKFDACASGADERLSRQKSGTQQAATSKVLTDLRWA